MMAVFFRCVSQQKRKIIERMLAYLQIINRKYEGTNQTELPSKTEDSLLLIWFDSNLSFADSVPHHPMHWCTVTHRHNPGLHNAGNLQVKISALTWRPRCSHCYQLLVLISTTLFVSNKPAARSPLSLAVHVHKHVQFQTAQRISSAPATQLKIPLHQGHGESSVFIG